MELESLLDLYSRALNTCKNYKNEGLREIELLKNRFNESYKIVPKEQWCVMFYMPWEYGDPDIVGSFNSEQEAKLFIDKWEEKRKTHIQQYLKENPDKDIYDIPSGPYLKAKKLEFNNTSQEIINEIRRNL